MTRKLVLVSVVFTLGLGWSFGVGPGGAQDPPALPDHATTKFPIAGQPYDVAVGIYQRNRDDLERLPGAQASGIGPEGIVVYTENPDKLPAHVAGIPVNAGPPIYPRIAGRSYRDVKAILARNRASLEQLPEVESIGIGTEGIVVHTANPDVLPLSIEGIPVQPGQSWGNPINGLSYMTARQIFQENEKDLLNLPGVQGGSLGLDGIHLYTSEPEALPTEVEGLPVLAKSPLHGPIVGIPFLEAKEIWERHRPLLEQIPGVQAVFLSPGGIAVYTDQPDLLPEELEDLPVEVFPPMPGG